MSTETTLQFTRTGIQRQHLKLKATITTVRYRDDLGKGLIIHVQNIGE